MQHTADHVELKELAEAIGAKFTPRKG